ncbi:MAG TPA: HD domain-containing protein [Anaerolineae bacterium]|nr:HD domain-containing protein [Anaerolineae bacterium]
MAADITADLVTELLAHVEQHLSVDECATVQRALELARTSHAGQRRDDGTPYFMHPLRTTIILIRDLGLRDATTICAALLHDAVEDQESLSADYIHRSIGPEVAEVVEVLTKPRVHSRCHSDVNTVYFPRLRAASEQVRSIKLADRLDNIRDLPNSRDPSKRSRMIDETRGFYVPLISTLTDPKRQAFLEKAFSQAINVVEDSVDA